MKKEVIEAAIDILLCVLNMNFGISRYADALSDRVGTDGFAVFLRHFRCVDSFRKQRRNKRSSPIGLPVLDCLFFIVRKSDREFYHARHRRMTFSRFFSPP